mmetsp:Transcript_91/g.218  ORF Transcript_91/g.218 Transcript_91/m.218 type:complete len:221 (-) Transcript_91:1842-2504(-)
MQSSGRFNLPRANPILAFLFVTILGQSQSLLQAVSYHPSRLLTTPASPFIALRNNNLQENKISRFAYIFPGVSRCAVSLDMVSSGYDGSSSLISRIEGDPHVETVLFVECGFGNDSHGQSSTKAAVRACRNAIEFNSIPSVSRLVPNGYKGLKLDVLLAVPVKYKSSLDISKVQEVFPYGSIRFQIQEGGMVAPSGIAIEKLGDTNEDMVVVCAAVTVGY